MRRPRLEMLPHPVGAVVLALVVWVVVLALRGLGVLQSLELKSYDGLLSLRGARPPVEDRITIVAIREADFSRYGWPIRDADLAALLTRLLSMGPRVVGVDIFRDRPEEPGHARLANLLATEPRLIVAMKYPGWRDSGIPPPPSVEDPARVGFADMVVDDDGTVRRGLLFLGGGDEARWAMGLRLALAWLAPYRLELAASDPNDPTAPPRLGKALLHRLPPNPVGYAGSDQSGWQFLMTYPFGRRPPPLYGVQEVLEDGVPEVAIRNRIVLVGTISESIKDQFLTPLAGGRTSHGVVLHAQIASQLLREALGEAGPLLPVPPWLDRLWALAWALAGAFAGLGLYGRRGLLTAAVLGSCALTAVAALLFLGGHWIGLVPPLVSGLGALVLVSFHLERREAAERAALSRLFKVHLSSGIADYLWSERAAFLERGRPRPQLLEATVLFSDVRDSTHTAERLSPPALIDWLNDYLSCMTDVVVQHGGIVDQFIGDGLMAVFGPPLQRTTEEAEADARAAVSCALSMAQALEDLSPRFCARGLPEIRIRVGIHKGQVVAGSIGSADRLQYALLGDTVNTAARLESWRDPDDGAGHSPELCRILISEAVWLCLGPDYRTESAGLLRLRGKDQPTAVYRVVGRALREKSIEEPVPCVQSKLNTPSTTEQHSGA